MAIPSYGDVPWLDNERKEREMEKQRYVRTSWQTSAGIGKVDTFTSVYLPEGMEATQETVRDHGKTHAQIEQYFSGAYTTDPPKYFHRGGKEF